MFKNDPIVDEIHEIRRQMLAEFGGDIDRLIKHLQEQQAKDGRKVVAGTPRPVKKYPAPKAAG